MRRKVRETVDELVDMKAFLDKFDDEYAFLYNNEDNVAGYMEAVDAFDNDLKKPKFKKFVQDFVAYRGDVISSDREAASFEFACESLGLFNKLLEHKGVSMRKSLGKYRKLNEEAAVVTPPPLNVVDGSTEQTEQPKKKDGRSFIYYIKAKAKNNQIDWENAYKDENDGYRWFLPLKYHHNAERVARAIKDNFRRGKLDVNVKLLPMPDDVDKPRYVELNFRNKKKERENPDEYKWVQESISKLNEELSKYLG